MSNISFDPDHKLVSAHFMAFQTKFLNFLVWSLEYQDVFNSWCNFSLVFAQVTFRKRSRRPALPCAS